MTARENILKTKALVLSSRSRGLSNSDLSAEIPDVLNTIKMTINNNQIRSDVGHLIMAWFYLSFTLKKEKTKT